MAESPLFRKMRDRAKELGTRAVDELLNGSPGSDAVVGAAVRGAQRGRKSLDENAGKVVGALGLATSADLIRIERKLGKLRKRLNSILDDLEA